MSTDLMDSGPPQRPHTGPPVLRAARPTNPAESNEVALESADTVDEEEARRHYQSYHDFYYSITPRDPRLAVPLKPIWPEPKKADSITAGAPEKETVKDDKPKEEKSQPPPAGRVSPALQKGVSPGEKPLSRSPGVTHQPYATPQHMDFLPSGLFDRSPSTNSFSLPGEATDFNVMKENAYPQPAAVAPGYFSHSSVVVMTRPTQIPVADTSSIYVQSAGVVPSVGHTAGSTGRSRGRGRGNQAAAHPPPTAPQNPSTPKSALLKEFHDNLRPNLSLFDLKGHIVEFSMDQDGSRLVQRLMNDETAADFVYEEVVSTVVGLIVDVFGNYVIQRLLETGSARHHRGLILAMKGSILPLSLQTYGCRVVQKALQYANHDDQRAIASELVGHVADCVRDQNGNHVIQKCIEMMPKESQFISDAFRGQLPSLACHAYGCRVMQRLFERCPNTDPSVDQIVQETLMFTDQLVDDQYGNYVIQHIVINGTAAWRQRVLQQLCSRFGKLSCSKFSSNVTEKLFLHSEEPQRRQIIETILADRDSQGRCALVFMMQDQFANYVVQRLFDLSPPPTREKMVEAILPWLPEIKRYTYGKHLVARLEKMGLLARSSMPSHVPGPAGPQTLMPGFGVQGQSNQRFPQQSNPMYQSQPQYTPNPALASGQHMPHEIYQQQPMNQYQGSSHSHSQSQMNQPQFQTQNANYGHASQAPPSQGQFTPYYPSQQQAQPPQQFTPYPNYSVPTTGYQQQSVNPMQQQTSSVPQQPPAPMQPNTYPPHQFQYGGSAYSNQPPSPNQLSYPGYTPYVVGSTQYPPQTQPPQVQPSNSTHWGQQSQQNFQSQPVQYQQPQLRIGNTAPTAPSPVAPQVTVGFGSVPQPVDADLGSRRNSGAGKFTQSIATFPSQKNSPTHQQSENRSLPFIDPAVASAFPAQGRGDHRHWSQ
jgi:hypothetical protein